MPKKEEIIAKNVSPSLYKRQIKVLTDRYLDCILGEARTLLMLILQAPIIAILIAWRFHDVSVTKFLTFSLALTSIWFGCTNAAREFVKERTIYARERLIGLSTIAYVFSKVKILLILAFIQSLFFILIINYYVPLNGFILLHILVAFLATFSGIAIGLFISSIVNSVHQADALIPIFLIPQILFSPFVMPENVLSGWGRIFDRMMPLRWSYYAFQKLIQPNKDGQSYIVCLGMIILISLVFIILSGFILKNKKILI